MPTLAFVKMHTAGNDFIVTGAVELARYNWPRVAQELCRRHFSIGADGLMVVERSEGGGYLARMFNPDGSEDVCGNGMLCVGLFLRLEGLIDEDHFLLDTIVGLKEMRLETPEGRAAAVSINMGRAHFEPARIPARFEGEKLLQHMLQVRGGNFTISSVSTGTTHTIIFDSSLPDDDQFFNCAPQIENHSLFPEKTSVTWVVVDSPRQVHVRIWERGAVGESLSCGTGAAAVAAVGHRLGLTSNNVAVLSKGGKLTVELMPDGQAWLTGTPKLVFSGRVNVPGSLLDCNPASREHRAEKEDSPDEDY